jgi:tetratricopeptide (TPR) repeat protein
MADDPLEAIRTAALETALDDPQGAVRVLRRYAKGESEAALLAHGALGELYLEDLGDYDAAEHHFRAALKLQPGLIAAELGLARTLGRIGRADDSRDHFRKTLVLLGGELAAGLQMIEAGRTAPPGLEEIALTLLEVSLEAREAWPEAPAPDWALFDRAEERRLFDALADDGEPDPTDWERYAAARAGLHAENGDAAAAFRALERVRAGGNVRASAADWIASLVLERSGDARAAVEAAVRSLDASPAAAWEEERVLRCAALAEAFGDAAGARTLLDRAAHAAVDPEARKRYEESRPSAPALVGLGTRGPSGGRG